MIIRINTAIILSTVLHLCLFLFPLLLVKQQPKPNQEERSVQVEIIAEPNDGDRYCRRFYGGIGLNYDLDGYTVVKVVPGYPAYEAGITPGSKMLQDSDYIRGTIGTPVTLTWITPNKKRLTRTLIRAKICLRD